MTQLVHFTLYETKTRYYIAGADISFSQYRISKIDKTVAQVSFTDDLHIYNEQELKELLGMISHGNKSTGGLKKRFDFCGIFGFVTFKDSYYMILITKKSPVALVGGHYINHIEDTIMVPINGKQTVSAEEERYVQIFSQVDRTKNFYYSYTYDITRSLQSNMTQGDSKIKPKDMFLWNDYLTATILEYDSHWFLPIIHGFVDQAKISVYGHNILVTLIARRSRFFAGKLKTYKGARFLKRGVCDKGYVANDVETEQIVHDASATFFTTPLGKNSHNPAYTSYLQNRGSIPLNWSQDISPMAAKPQIELDLVDPFYTSTAKHFNDLFHRYGSPVIVLNLVKAKERIKRESILLDEFTNAINYLNQKLPVENKLIYIPWDMARASKIPDQDVIGTLEKIARDALDITGIFHSGEEPFANAIRRADIEGKDIKHDHTLRLQQGILRTNCIDCLDRTNAAQFVVGKHALGLQLYSLGVIPSPSVPFDCDAINIFNAMYHDHGDTIALQYGGSHLVNTMETYRKMSAWTSHSRDMIEGIKRYYSNSFTDAEKQHAINLFLGYYVAKDNTIDLWDLSSDFYMHNRKPFENGHVKSYLNWFDKEGLQNNELSGAMTDEVVEENLKKDFDQFKIYYNPDGYTQLDKLFSFRMMSTNSNVSSFVPRINSQGPASLVMYNLNIGGVRKWLRPSLVSVDQIEEEKKPIPPTKVDMPNFNSGKLGVKLLIPAVKVEEEREYLRYIQQFKHAAINGVLDSTVDDTSTQLEKHPDYEFFKANVTTSDDDLKDCFVIAVKDEKLYKGYLVSGNTESYVGLGTRSQDLKRIERYQHWKDTGIYKK